VPEWQGRDPGDVIMVGHPTRLWGMGPGRRKNAGATANINALGLRGELPIVPRSRGRERVLVTGDSSFFGHGVADDASPPALLADDLRGAGIDADTVNGAIPGYSTEQTRILLDEVGWGVEPTLLVVCNFWSDFNFDHFRDEDLLRTRQAFVGNPIGRSAVYRLLVGAFDRVRGGDAARVVTWSRHSRFPEDGVRRVPPNRYAENLDAIVRDAKARGIGVVLLTPTNRDMARGDASGAEVRAPYVEAQREVAAWHGIPVVDTAGSMTAAAVGDGAARLYLDDLHPSAAGNAVIARAIVDGLVAAGWPTNRLEGRAEAFDASGIVDTARDSRGASPGAMSPQVNLFPGGAEHVQAVSAETNGAETSWVLVGTVRGPPGPVEIAVRAVNSDEKLGGVVLRDETRFQIAVPAGHDRVRVEVTSAGGRVEALGSRNGAALALVIGS
jgi:lysophospholipase L1-like esterase